MISKLILLECCIVCTSSENVSKCFKCLLSTSAEFWRVDGVPSNNFGKCSDEINSNHSTV